MTIFLRLLANEDKAASMLNCCGAVRENIPDSRVFQVESDAFRVVPDAPFAYWASEASRCAFSKYPPFESDGRAARVGLQTSDDFRFIRLWWETPETAPEQKWFPFAKGGPYSPFYGSLDLELNWLSDGRELKAWADPLYGNSGWSRILKSTNYYFRPGFTWPNATTLGISVRTLPRSCIFGHMGPSAFVKSDNNEEILSYIAIANSTLFTIFLEMQLALAAEGRKHYEVGLLQQTPVPSLDASVLKRLASLALNAWKLRRSVYTTNENSHVFLVPLALCNRVDTKDSSVVEAEFARIKIEIDALVFELYGFTEADRTAALASKFITRGGVSETIEPEDADGEEDNLSVIDQTSGVLNWAVGVAFGRFDWRLVTGERAPPPEPDPFEPLPAKSPGMLPNGAEPFHAHASILVDDAGHPHDLAHWVEEVLARFEAPALTDVRRWLQRDFFASHLKHYSKSRRKAPIYWPLSTASGAYTLWLYYPRLTSQTLYTAVNDFIEGPNGKLKRVEQEGAVLRNKGSARSRDEEKKLEALQLFETELVELRDTLLRIAPSYRPNHDDGVQITAAPLWQLFCHKPWQKILKDTWAKLEKGDYDWARLTMAYWPERVREKCKANKSLAIAHNLEHLHVEPAPKPAKSRGRRKDIDE